MDRSPAGPGYGAHLTRAVACASTELRACLGCLERVECASGSCSLFEHRRVTMNGNRHYAVRVEGAKYGVGFGSALAIAISYTNNHSILWAIIDGILGWLYVIYYALFRS